MNTKDFDATEQMLVRLRAGSPDPAIADELRLFGQLAGSWDLQMTAFGPDGKAEQFVGEWHFGWILGGDAIQDVLITRSPAGDVVGYGTTVRTFDRARRIWWTVWQDPLAGEFSVLFGKRDGNAIALEGEWTVAGRDAMFRWTFSDITDDSFQWEARISRDGGGTWQLREAMSAHRVASVPQR